MGDLPDVGASQLTERQLAALAELGSLLDSAGLDSWLFGGWAVDFHAGRITRVHDDLDVAVWAEDADAVASLLGRSAWRLAPEPGDQGWTGYTRDGLLVELTYVVRDDAGRIFVPLPDGSVLWSEESFGNEVRELHGVRARVVPLHVLRGDKSSPREDPGAAAKDRVDLDALSGLDP